MSQFIVGRSYKVTVPDFYKDCGLTEVGQVFTCDLVDSDGACWSDSCKFQGEEGRWCVATGGSLDRGDVELIDQTIESDDAANLITLDKRDLFDFVRTAIKYAMLEQGSREDDAELYADATDRTEKCLSDLYGSRL